MARYLGTRKFVERVRERLAIQKPQEEVAWLQGALPRMDLGSICRIVSDAYVIEESEIRVKGRNRTL